MVGKHKQVHVLSAGLASIRNDTWIIHEYYVSIYITLVSDYSQVVSTQQDSLTSI